MQDTRRPLSLKQESLGPPSLVQASLDGEDDYEAEYYVYAVGDVVYRELWIDCEKCGEPESATTVVAPGIIGENYRAEFLDGTVSEVPGMVFTGEAVAKPKAKERAEGKTAAKVKAARLDTTSYDKNDPDNT